MRILLPNLTVDDCPDALGFSTIRVDDGTPNGDTEGDVIATIYLPEFAAALAEAPAMLEALREARRMLVEDEGYKTYNPRIREFDAILSRIDGAAPPIPAAPAPSGGIEGLPEGYAMERDQDGDPILIPPANVTIFSEPGEGWLVTADYMQGRDWNSESDVIAACCDYLRSIGREG